ncbi:MAG: chemotaxis protein CheW [Cyanobacteria bacterium P01_H01_bin.121]
MIGMPDFLAAKGQDQGPEMQELETPEGELHMLFFTPSGNQFALPAIGISEALLQSPDRITPIPNVSPLILGTLNKRGRVIWVADLGQFLGESGSLNTDRTEIPVIAIEDQDMMLGLAVQDIIGMSWRSIDDIQMPTNISDSMAPFVRGEWVPDSDDDQRLRLLDQVSILRSARWVT